MVRVPAAVLERPAVMQADDLGWPVMSADDTATPTEPSAAEETPDLGAL